MKKKKNEWWIENSLESWGPKWLAQVPAYCHRHTNPFLHTLVTQRPIKILARHNLQGHATSFTLCTLIQRSLFPFNHAATFINKEKATEPLGACQVCWDSSHRALGPLCVVLWQRIHLELRQPDLGQAIRSGGSQYAGPMRKVHCAATVVRMRFRRLPRALL